MSTKLKKEKPSEEITVTMHTENKESNCTGQSDEWIGGYMESRSKDIQHSQKNNVQLLNELKDSDDCDDDDDDDDDL